MPSRIDMTGQTFSRLTVLEQAQSLILPSGKPRTRWLARCECGNLTVVHGDSLRTGNTRSCGCLDRETTAARSRVSAPGYRAAHYRVSAAKGPASAHLCADCLGPAQEWSYDHADPSELVEGGMAYSADPNHYLPRCVPCHRIADAVKEIPNG